VDIAGLINSIDSFIWGAYFGIPLLLGTGIMLLFLLRGVQFRWFGRAWRYIFGKGGEEEGDITPFQALSAAMAGTIGVGNIAGVATAIALGGLGALFWMWIAAILGMGTKYAEVVLGTKYRKDLPDGTKLGGAFAALERTKLPWLGMVFSVFTVIASLGIGNMNQANSIAVGFEDAFGLPRWISGIICSVGIAIILIGGIQRLGKTAAAIVPFMSLIYIAGGIGVLIVFRENIVPTISMIFHDAFTGSAATGGFAGSTLAMALQYGVARGIFSNEAGLGSAPMAHSTAKSDAVRQATVSILEPFIDTIIVCSITGLTIGATGAWSTGMTSTALTQEAFRRAYGPAGGMFVAIALILFAFTTILSWNFYSRQNLLNIVQHIAKKPGQFEKLYPLVSYSWIAFWIVLLTIGTTIEVELLWSVSDIFNGLMMVPNLICIWLLARELKKMTEEGG
jgi:AGCS family alanine or glycine:cation symporter